MTGLNNSFTTTSNMLQNLAPCQEITAEGDFILIKMNLSKCPRTGYLLFYSGQKTIYFQRKISPKIFLGLKPNALPASYLTLKDVGV